MTKDELIAALQASPLPGTAKVVILGRHGDCDDLGTEDIAGVLEPGPEYVVSMARMKIEEWRSETEIVLLADV